MFIKKTYKKISIVMGSQSDFKTMKFCKKVLTILKIKHEIKIVSAHRTPDRMYQFAKKAEKNNIAVIIAGAGGSAHLPGMTAAKTSLPVIGVPVKSSNSIDGWDSVLSILQMPNGIPVATVALNAAKNAGIEIKISGLEPLTHIEFIHSDSACIQTLYTQEMLARGYLLGSSVYTTFAYDDELINSFVDDTHSVFKLLKKAMDSTTPETYLDGKVKHTTFNRLT